QLARIIFADVHRIGAVPAQRPEGAPPGDVEDKRRVAAQAIHSCDIAVSAINLQSPCPGTHQPARASVPAVENVEQGAEQNEVSDPAEPDDDGTQGGCYWTGRHLRKLTVTQAP